MGTAAERVEREIDVLVAESGYRPEADRNGADWALAAVADYKDGLESLVRDLADRIDRRVAGGGRTSTVRGQQAAGKAGGLPPGSQRFRIVQHLSGLGLLSDEGQITDEIAGATGIPLNSVSTRMSELLRDGWIAESGEHQSKTRYAATDKAKGHFAPGLSAV